MTPSRKPLSHRWAPVVALAALATTGCTSTAAPAAVAPTPAASAVPAASQTPIDTAALPASQQKSAQAALVAYRDYWRLVNAAMAAPDKPWDSKVSARAAGDELENLTRYLAELRARDEHVTGTTRIDPKVLAVRAGTVVIGDCVDTSAADIVAEDGSSVKDTGGAARYPSEARVSELVPGQWRVTWTGDLRSQTC